MESKPGSLYEALGLLGLSTTDTNAYHLMVMVRALQIFERHTERIGEMWRESDALHNAHHIKHKSDRIYHAERYEKDKEFALDSALDLVNYAVFYIRQKENDNG